MATSLRPAAAGDAEMLHRWVNHPDSLRNKLRTTDPVDLTTHRAWFDERLRDPTTSIWIVEDAGTPVGQVRLEPGPEGSEIDVFLTEAARGRGIAGAALEEAIRRAPQAAPRPFIARVRPTNIRSRRVFEHLGFTVVRVEDDHVMYARDRES